MNGRERKKEKSEEGKNEVGWSRKLWPDVFHLGCFSPGIVGR
jgi:hypothetical protein